MNGYEESYVVMQEWKFDLDEKDDVSSNQAQSMVAKKKTTMNFCRILSFEHHGHKLLQAFFKILKRKI
jgi:hypothetical protein